MEGRRRGGEGGGGGGESAALDRPLRSGFVPAVLRDQMAGSPDGSELGDAEVRGPPLRPLATSPPRVWTCVRPVPLAVHPGLALQSAHLQLQLHRTEVRQCCAT